MNFVLKALFVAVCVFIVSNSEAVIVLKTKSNQALIHLEGLKTKKGTYFEAIDLYGEKKGLVQIKRVGKKKAIGVLKWGRMAKRWSLEPVSKRKAIAVQKKARRKAKIARIQREKIKRKLARRKSLEKQKKLARRKLARRRKAKKRSIASYEEEQGEYILNELPQDSDYQSQEVLSNNLSDQEEVSSDFSANDFSYSNESELSSMDSEDKNTNFDSQEVYINTESHKRFALGLAPRAEYGLMKLNPSNKPGYLMHGFGGGLFVIADFSLNNFIRAGGSFGGKYFSTSSEEQKCGQKRGCQLTIYYLSASLSLKLNLITFVDHKLWFAGEGVLMQPLAYTNNTLTKQSFSPFHGTLGGGLGIDFDFGNFVMPISINGQFYMPSSKTVMAGTAGLQVGLAYKF